MSASRSPGPVLVIVGLLILGLGPIATIESVNLLFGSDVPLTWGTYFAVMWLGGAVRIALTAILESEKKS